MVTSVRNLDTGCLEGATQVECPYCTGGRDKPESTPCAMCYDVGKVWKTTQGSHWYRRLGEKLTKSFKWGD